MRVVEGEVLFVKNSSVKIAVRKRVEQTINKQLGSYYTLSSRRPIETQVFYDALKRELR